MDSEECTPASWRDDEDRLDQQALVGRGDANSDDDQSDDESDFDDLPELTGRDDSDSDDDVFNEELDDEEDFFHKPSYEKIRKSAPNRLMNIKQMRTVIKNNLTKCPVCKNPKRELCDGKTFGLEIDIIIRCGSSDTQIVDTKNTFCITK